MNSLVRWIIGVPSVDNFLSKLNIEQALKQIVEPIFASKIRTGLAVGILHGTNEHVALYGNANIEKKTPLREDSIFEIGSITKLFTANLLCALHNSEHLKLNSRLETVYPPLFGKQIRREVQLLDLATHTSGFPSMPTNFYWTYLTNRKNPYLNYSAQQRDKALEKIMASTGTAKYNYSNFGYGVLGEALQATANLPYDDLLQRELFTPLSMNSSLISFERNPNLRNNFVTGYKTNGQATPHWDLPTLKGAGAVRSTVPDMMKYLKANACLHSLNDEKLVGILKRAQQPEKSINQDTTVCVGWHRQMQKNEEKSWQQEILFHSGGTGGFASFIGFDLQSNTGVVLLSNSPRYFVVSWLGTALLASLERKTSGLETTQSHPSA